MSKIEIKDQAYIDAYDKIGHKYFCRGSDQDLKEWGQTHLSIRSIKIETIKTALKYSDLKVYKVINEILGGKNML